MNVPNYFDQHTDKHITPKNIETIGEAILANSIYKFNIQPDNLHKNRSKEKTIKRNPIVSVFDFDNHAFKENDISSSIVERTQ